MTKDQAFALHIRSLLMDLANGTTGTLRSVAERVDLDLTYPSVNSDMQPVERTIHSFLMLEADVIQRKLGRALKDIEEYCGGSDNFRALAIEDFDSGFAKSAREWKDA